MEPCLQYMVDMNVNIMSNYSINTNVLINSSLGNWLLEEDIFHENGAIHTFIIFIYAIIIFIGFIENVGVLVVFFVDRKLHSSTNKYIAVLSVSHIFLSAVNLPLQLHSQIIQNWVFGSFMCKIFSMLFSWAVVFQALCVTNISIDCYITVIRDKKAKRLPFRYNVLIMVAITMLLSAPLLLQNELRVLKLTDITITRCLELVDLPYMAGYIVSMFFVCLLAPVVLITTLYRCIDNVATSKLIQSRETMDRSRRLRTVMKFKVLTYVLLLLPWYSFKLWFTSFPGSFIDIAPYVNTIDLITKAVCGLTSCINPYFYVWLNANFRRSIKIQFKTVRLRSRARSCNTSSQNHIIAEIPMKISYKRTTV